MPGMRRTRTRCTTVNITISNSPALIPDRNSSPIEVLVAIP